MREGVVLAPSLRIAICSGAFGGGAEGTKPRLLPAVEKPGCGCRCGGDHKREDNGERTGAAMRFRRGLFASHAPRDVARAPRCVIFLRWRTRTQRRLVTQSRLCGASTRAGYFRSTADGWSPILRSASLASRSSPASAWSFDSACGKNLETDRKATGGAQVATSSGPAGRADGARHWHAPCED
jgi:hypothetical protein